MIVRGLFPQRTRKTRVGRVSVGKIFSFRFLVKDETNGTINFHEENPSNRENFEVDQANRENQFQSSATSFQTSDSEKQNSNRFVRTFPAEENFSIFDSNYDQFYFDKNSKEDEIVDLTGPNSSFDALMNSLKSIRERTLEFSVRSVDDHFIPVAD